MGVYSDNADATTSPDAWLFPGAATADTVRYLRLHHMAHPYEVAGDQVDPLLHSTQPELCGQVYSTLVRTLVLRGCLGDA